MILIRPGQIADRVDRACSVMQNLLDATDFWCAQILSCKKKKLDLKVFSRIDKTMKILSILNTIMNASLISSVDQRISDMCRNNSFVFIHNNNIPTSKSLSRWFTLTGNWKTYLSQSFYR